MESQKGLRIKTVEMRGIVKTFPGVLANDNVDIDVHAGEVLALLGENGAGKTTLMKVLYGLYRPDKGQIFINGEPVSISSPRDAIDLGIGMVHQHFMLVPSLTVTENVVLGLKSPRAPLLDLESAAKRINELACKYNLAVDPYAPVWQLSVGEQQRVEIIKALYRGAELLIMDEPTAVLTPQEADELIRIMRGMADSGQAIILITHKLNEVMAVSDRVTVLRHGKVVDTVLTKDANVKLLAQMMVERDIPQTLRTGEASSGKPVLVLENIWANSDKGHPALRGLSLEVREGEILGIAGVSGNGQRELAQVIAGLRKVSSGSIRLKDKDVTNTTPAEMIKAGLGYIPEDRIVDGIVGSFSVEENLILKDHHKPPFSRGIFLQKDAISKFAEEMVDTYDIRTPTTDTQASHLSGGNIQRLILARDMSRHPICLLSCYPSRGLDIAATEYVRKKLLGVRAEGCAIILISEDLEEILNLSDRVAVLYEGQIDKVADVDDVTLEEMGFLMAGGKPTESDVSEIRKEVTTEA
ncbi:MAG: ABC transporter ATP-binding protein [Bacillota bacterium]